MYVDFVVGMVLAGLFRYEMLQCILLRDIARRLSNSTSEGKLVDVCVLVLHVRRCEFLGQALIHPDPSLLVAVTDVLPRDIVPAVLHDLVLDGILKGINLNRLFHILAMRVDGVRDSLDLLLRQFLVFLDAIVCLADGIEDFLLCQWFDFPAPFYNVHISLMSPL